jgi:hypothetical protein
MGLSASVRVANPRSDLAVMLRGETEPRAFPAGAWLTVGVAGHAERLELPGGVLEAMLVFPAAALPETPQVDVRLEMSGTFVPARLGFAPDPRELGFWLHRFWAGPASALPARGRPAPRRAAIGPR